MAKTLHYDFAGDKSLTAKVGPTLSITRATDASYFDSAGVLQTAASGEARFDHNPVTGDSLGLLVEEARTNLCLQSEDFSAGNWQITFLNSAINTNATTDPRGGSTADRLIDDAAASGNVVVGVRQNAITLQASTQHVFSCYLKADQLSWAIFRVANWTSPAGTPRCWFDLTNGVVGTLGAGWDASGIEDAGNGWYRCWAAFTIGATDVQGDIHIELADANNDSFVADDGTSSIFVWGAQIEAGAFPTSYIPTVAASVTRNSDNVFSTDVSWYNVLGGSVYGKGQAIAVTTASDVFVDISDTSTSDRWLVQSGSSNAAKMLTVAIGDDASLQSTETFVAGVDSHFAYATMLDDAEFYMDGTRSGTGDQTVDMPSGINRISIGARYNGGGNFWNGHIAEIAYFDERLDNDTLEDYSLNGIPSGGINYIAITRRTFNGPPKRIPYPKPKRGLFR